MNPSAGRWGSFAAALSAPTPSLREIQSLEARTSSLSGSGAQANERGAWAAAAAATSSSSSSSSSPAVIVSTRSSVAAPSAVAAVATPTAGVGRGRGAVVPPLVAAMPTMNARTDSPGNKRQPTPVATTTTTTTTTIVSVDAAKSNLFWDFDVKSPTNG